MIHELKRAPGNQKFCKDCKYFHKPLLTKLGLQRETICTYLQVNEPEYDLVTGKPLSRYTTAKSMRSAFHNTLCSTEAKWFEPKEDK